MCKLSCDIWDRKIRHDACGLNISCVSLFFIPVSSLFLTASFVPGRVQMTIFNVFLQFDVATSFVGRVSQIWDVIAWDFVTEQPWNRFELRFEINKSVINPPSPSLSSLARIVSGRWETFELPWKKPKNTENSRWLPASQYCSRYCSDAPFHNVRTRDFSIEMMDFCHDLSAFHYITCTICICSFQK